MTLTADTTIRKRAHTIESMVVVNADIVYAGALVALGMPGHGSAGYLIPYAPATLLLPIGFAIDGAVTGDTTATPPTRMSVDTGGGDALLTVVGMAGTQADVGDLVWASADNVFTLVEQDAGYPIGRVIEQHSSTQLWVNVYSKAEFFLMYQAQPEPDFSPTPTPTATPTPT